jgi:hypothetical protein
MRQVTSGVLSVLFVIGLAGVSMAGMMDELTGKADEAKESAAEAHKGMDMKETEAGKAIEAKDATKEEAGGMMDQVKEGAKEKTNETIDNIGK